MSPTEHEFSYPLFMMYLDLDEVPEVFDGKWCWSARGPAAAWFRRRDYMGDGSTDLAESVRNEAERLTGTRPAGAIRMLTNLRYLGVVMNPVTFYYCFPPECEHPDIILAEITNTPWRERHTYALHSGTTSGGVTETAHRFPKDFHVSPFMSMDQEYVWHMSSPHERLTVHMENLEGDRKLFDATLRLKREEISSASLAGALLRFPWMSARIAAGIYWQALRLRAKRTPFHRHPRRPDR